METVTSKDNRALKTARKLLTRKGREEAGAFLVEGRKLISEAASAGFQVERVFVNAGALLRGEAEAGQWASEIVLEEKLFLGLAQTTSPQPFIAVARRPARPVCAGGGLPERVLVLDRISDPGNAGTMARTALASGIDMLWCVKGTADLFSDKAIRASAGAVFHLPAREGLSAGDCVSMARDLGLKLVVCDAGGTDLYAAGLGGRIAIVIGNESNGAGSEFLDAAGAIVSIPMGKASESLNAAVAAAVVMYESFRQRNVLN